MPRDFPVSPQPPVLSLWSWGLWIHHPGLRNNQAYGTLYKPSQHGEQAEVVADTLPTSAESKNELMGVIKAKKMEGRSTGFGGPGKSPWKLQLALGRSG